VSNSSFSPASSEAAPPTALYAERTDARPLGEPPAPIFAALQLQGRVIWALILREILTRFGRRNLGFLWLFLEPAIFIVAFAAIFSAMRAGAVTDISITAFLLTGYGTVLLWRNMAGRCIRAMAPNLPLLYHHQVRPLDVYIARMALDAAGATISFILLAFVFYRLGLAEAPHDVLKVLIGWALVMWYGAALGLLLGPLSERSELIEKIWLPLSIVLMLTSGAFFMLEAMPPQMRDVFLWFPPINCVEYLREGYFGPGHTFYYDLGYVALFNAVLMLIGLAQVRYISRHISFA
jgi:ABC-type polysaccharide/polyol phosphate export permease